jgi:FHIPEP family
MGCMSSRGVIHSHDWCSEAVSAVHRSTLLLSGVLGLLIFQSVLPSQMKMSGLWSWAESATGLSWPQRWLVILALLFAFIVASGVVHYLPHMAKVRSPFETWPSGAARRLFFERVVAYIAVAFVLFRLPHVGETLAVLFLGAMLVLFRMVRKGTESRTRFCKTLLALWELRLCWIGVLIWAWFFETAPAADSLTLVYAGSGFLVSFVIQPCPQLSFSFCFLTGPRDWAAAFDRALWIGRLERLFLGTLLVAGFFVREWGALSLLASLGTYCWSRVVFQGCLGLILRKPTWAQRLRGRVGLCVCGCGQRFPNSVSLEAHEDPKFRGPPIPVDTFRGRAYLPVASRLARNPKPVTLEVVVCLLLLSFSLAWLGIQSCLHRTTTLSGTGNYQARLFSADDVPVLVISNPDQFVLTLVDAVLRDVKPRQTRVRTRDEVSLYLWMCGLCFVVLLYDRSRPERQRKKFVQTACLGAIGTGVIASGLGWAWIPLSLALGVFVVAVVSFQLPGLPDWVRRPRAMLENGKQVVGRFHEIVFHEYGCEVGCRYRPLGRVFLPKSVDGLSIEVGRGLIGLVDPRDGAVLLDRVTQARREYTKMFGVPLPGIRFRDNLQLKPNSYRFMVRDCEVGQGELRADQLFPQSDVSSLIVRHFLLAITPYLYELMTIEETEKILNRATEHHDDLVKRVRQTHTLRTVRKVLRSVLKDGYTIGDYGVWLKVLVNNVGSDEELAEAVRREIGKVGARQWEWVEEFGRSC